MHGQVQAGIAGAVILAGGASRRMGKNKAALELGGKRFLEILAEEFRPLGKVYISYREKEEGGPGGEEGFFVPAGAVPVRDDPRFRGPLAGIGSGLRAMKDMGETGGSYAFVIACDMPFTTRDLAAKLLGEAVRRERGLPEAVIPVTPDGKRHPLAALYRIEASLEKAEELLLAGERKALRLAESLDTLYLPLSGARWERELVNINDPADYRRYVREEGEEP